ncbi:hypothetical protein COCON_G00098780 [Conger conger]|uniref:Calponin-homology (CH) domain-containing protein n=1 Tax=Conger conger TaxID=82655 RepID=A0A9Q1DMJ1_CONCO|nr:hypothetical protein COCON_G00098780 [Conger conger]
MARYKDVSMRKTTSLNLVTGFFQYLRDEQEAVQKRTFTKWINSHLAKGGGGVGVMRFSRSSEVVVRPGGGCPRGAGLVIPTRHRVPRSVCAEPDPGTCRHYDSNPLLKASRESYVIAWLWLRARRAVTTLLLSRRRWNPRLGQIQPAAAATASPRLAAKPRLYSRNTDASPLVVNDLFEDIKDGVMLLALLEILSGQKLPCEQGRQLKRIHWVSNIGTALKFLEGRRIKLVNINSTDIVDGRPSIVLGLVWTIILYFQIEELTSNLPALQALSGSSSSVDSMASSETGSPPVKRKVITKFQGNAKKALLRWVQFTAATCSLEDGDRGDELRGKLAQRGGVPLGDPRHPAGAGGHGARAPPDQPPEPGGGLLIGRERAGHPRLLDPEDVDVDKPDEKSIMTYVAQFLKHYPDPHGSETDGGQDEEREQRKVLREMKTWLEQLERDVGRAQGAEGSLTEKYQAFKTFRVQFEVRRKQADSLLQPPQRDAKLTVDQALVKQAWERVSARLLDWHIQLDKALPAPLGVIGAWLHRAELALREDVAIQQAHEETANALQRTLEQHKEVLKNLEGHKQAFQQIHRDRSVNGVPVPPEQLQDMAERFNYVSTSSHVHLIKLEFWEMKYRLLAFLMLAESKLKSWIIKYGRRESVELLLQNYITFIEGHKFFEQYETTYQTLKQAAEVYVKSDISAEEGEGVSKFLTDTAAQWRNLAVEVRSVRSMLEEVISNWEKYSSTVAGLQAWLEDAEKMLNQPENAKREFFRNLPHWIQQHTAMNDAGNFLIETCDETVSRDLKQQLLLLNGRWRELFVKVKQYARADEVDKMRKDYQDGISSLKSFVDTASEKMTAPVQVSFLNVRTFVQDIEDIKHKVPAMESQYKMATRNAQLLTKDTPQEEVAQMLAAMATIKEQLSKIRERYLPLLREAQALLSPLEEMEKQISGFYQSLEKASRITAARDSEASSDFKHKCQDLLTYQQSCKNCLSVMERHHQTVQRALGSTKTLRHFDKSLLQKRVQDLQATLQAMVKEAAEWRKHLEANSSLMKRFEESRLELEKVLKTAHLALREKGNPEELLKKHTEFFGQLDQRVLNAFLKACDELTDILPEQEQQSLQETVRKLHKQWKDVQAESPYHLLHLKVEVERSRLTGSLQECRAELARENKALPSSGSERLVKEHRAFFREKGPQALCEKRLQNMEDLCKKLPEGDSAHRTTEGSKKALSEVRSQIDSTYQKLQQHPDKWKEFNSRFSELSAWLSSKESQLRLLRNRASDPSKYGQVKSTIEELRRDAEEQEGNLGWLKARLAALIEVCTDGEAKKQGAALTKLSADFKALISSLAESEKVVSAVGDCVQFRGEVQGTLEELLQGQQEAQEEVRRILDTPNVREAQQLFLIYQQQLKHLRAKRKEAELQIARGQQLQVEGVHSSSLQPDLQRLEETLGTMDQTTEAQERGLQVTLAAWQVFESEREVVQEFVSKASGALERELTFSSLESLSAELQQARELSRQSKLQAAQAVLLLQRAAEIQLGPQNQAVLQQQAGTLSEQAQRVEQGLQKDVEQLETMKAEWEKFGRDFEDFSSWISEKEKVLDALNAASNPLESQINTVKAVGAELEERVSVLPRLEAESQALGRFVGGGPYPGAADPDRAVLGGAAGERRAAGRAAAGERRPPGPHQRQPGTGEKHDGRTQRHTGQSCHFLYIIIRDLQSPAEPHGEDACDVTQALEQLKATLQSLSAGLRRLGDRAQPEREVSALQQGYEEALRLAKEKQGRLEGLLSLWQKYEKERSAFQAWVERCESACCSEPQHLSADKAKLQAELQAVKELQSEVASHESMYQGLAGLGTSLHPTAPEGTVRELQEDLQGLEKRWRVQTQAIPQRMEKLQAHISQVERFDEALLQVSQWSQDFLDELQANSHVDITDLQAAEAHVKERSALLQTQAGAQESLQRRADALCASCGPGDLQLLQGRREDCLQPFLEARRLSERRCECLERLAAFLRTRAVARSVLRGLRQSVEGSGSWDKGRAESLRRELEAVVPDIGRLETLAVGLDAGLSKAHLHLCEGGPEGRTSCRALADALASSLEEVQNLLGTRQSEAEALGALWTSFRQRKEQLLRGVEDVEERASEQGLREPSLAALQQRLRFFGQLEDELSSFQHEEQWLRDRGTQLAQRDSELAGEALREIAMVASSWEDTKKLIADSQEQSATLVELMREYQSLRSSVHAVVDGAESVAEIKSPLKGQEDIRRLLSRHEAAKLEMVGGQEQLDQFTSKGKHLLNELKKVPDCETQLVRKDMDAIVDQWLDVSERLEENIERLRKSAALWEDVRKIDEDTDGWAGGSVAELSESLGNFSSSQRMEARLARFQVEVEEKEAQLEELQVKVSELKQLTRNPDTPTELQVMEADLRKRIGQAQEISEQARSTLRDFSSQKQQLEDFISQMTEWLQNVEDSLAAPPHGSDPEHICRVKDIQKELQNQESGIDSTRENLSSLCRKYPSEELARLGARLTDLIKRNEAVNQRCARTLSALQDGLQQRFNELVQQFHGWLSKLKEGVKGCTDQSGDTVVMENKLRKIKPPLFRALMTVCVPFPLPSCRRRWSAWRRAETRLTRVCEEGEKLLLHLPKASAGQVQQQLSHSQQDWDTWVEQCRQSQQELEQSAALLGGFEGRLKRLASWLDQMEESAKAELVPENKQHLPEKKEELERVEEFHKELQKERDSFERLCQESQALSEAGRGDGGEVREASRLQGRCHALLKEVKEQQRSCLATLQEHQAFEETLHGTWAWLRGLQERLASLKSTAGSKEALEKRLGLVQDILLMKGEGEVKLNMAVGKGEQALKSSREEGREAIRAQLQSLKDMWANVLMSSISCHSRLEWTVAQWSSFQEGSGQLQQWMECVEQEVGAPHAPQPGLKEKASQLDRFRAVLADVESHSSTLSRLTEKAAELHAKTGDPAFSEEARTELHTHFSDITAVVKGKVKAMEDVVEEHERYLEAVRDLTDWLASAREELQRWADTTGDPASVQRKLAKVRVSGQEVPLGDGRRPDCVRNDELMESRPRGRERLLRLQRSAGEARERTAAAGCEAMDREEAGLRGAWEQWEGAALRARDGLEGALAHMASSEREFSGLAERLDRDLLQLAARLHEWAGQLAPGEGRADCEEAVRSWRVAKDILEGLQNMEPMADSLKTQLNDLCRFSRDLGVQSERVSALIKEYNSLSLQASRECQNKEKLLEQRFRTAFRDFQQWLVNAKINTAKCFDIPQSISEASAGLVKIQEFLNDREEGQTKLNSVVHKGELLSSIVAKDRVETIRAKMTSARDDWKSLMANLHKRETALQNLQSQMRDFEASAEPLQDWLNGTESLLQESSTRLHDLPAKKQELHKLQSVLEEISSQEGQLGRLREKAQQLWEGQAAGKGFVHRVAQLSAQYLALSSLTKRDAATLALTGGCPVLSVPQEKASRIERIVSEHQLFSQGLRELQNWVADASHMLQTYCCPTADKNVLDSRMIKLEALLTARQEKEIQLKMLITRGESVQRNTSPEGVPVVRKQIQDLKDSWDCLLSASIQCKSQLEGALSQWTSYQDDVRQFVSWMERVEESLSSTDKQYSEMRDKTANLGKAKLLHEEVLSHSSTLETIGMKGSNMAEHYVTQLEIQDLQERYSAIKDKAKAVVCKAEELVLAHQEYQRGLHMFEDWLEQEQERLGCHSQLEGDVEALESTLQELQELQVRCSEGQALVGSVLGSREKVIPWGVPQIEDRALETVQQEWRGYQARLGEGRARLNSVITKLRQMEHKFQHLDEWLRTMEVKGQLRAHRRSDRATKEAQLQLLQRWQEEALLYQEEVDGLGALAQQVLEEIHISSRVSARATQLTARYHALLLHLMETIKQLQEEVRCIEEAQGVFSTFSDWLSTAQRNFRTVAVSIDAVDRLAMDRKMKKLEALQSDMEPGHSFLKAMREKTGRAMAFLEEDEAEQLRGEVEARLAQLKELTEALRAELSGLEKCLLLSKEFLDKYKAQAQWLAETRALLSSPVEPKAELYQKKAQLAKYKTILQTAQSHESAVRSVVEKGEALLDMVRDPSVSENMAKLGSDYQELGTMARAHVQTLEGRVKEHESYNSDLQEVEKWLLQMSSRLVTSDSIQSSSLEVSMQQLARHKAIMEEIAGFEERLTSLKEKGDALVEGCGEPVQARIRLQVQPHQQGTRDSYSAICSTAQRVYQSLDRELQKHVSHQDTLQQCQTWLSSVQDELQLPAHPPFSQQEALKQVKHDRALQEQASTYLDLVCSVCDLSNETVRSTASEIQQLKLMIEERMLRSQDLADSWKEVREQKTELAAHLQDRELQLQSLNRRPGELEPKIAQNMLAQVKEFSQQLQAKQGVLTQMTEAVSRLTEGQESPEHADIARLSHTWLELCHQASRLLRQQEEDLQGTAEYHGCISAMELLFTQVSKEWDNLARTDTESSSEHLEALRKLAGVLEEQRGTLDDLRDHRQKVLPRLNLDDKELVKEQVGHFEQRWAQLETLMQKKIQDSVLTLEDMSQVESRLREAREWAEEQQPALSEAMKMSPPPELAQSFLFDHLSICSELEAKQLLLAQAISDADRVLAHLGLNERQRLQQLIADTQAEVETLGAKVVQRRKYLSKAFTERTQFLLAVGQAIGWVQQSERKALAEERVALLPDDLGKQVRTCRNIQSSLRAYQSELTSLWSQGRELMKDATEDEKAELLVKLQELQSIFETALQRCSQRLQELEKALVSRKYFKVDLDKTCQWLKQADIITFPEINLMNGDAELSVQLAKYQQILEQATEYENLLLIVQRAGQEILPTLNEVDHCYLDEKLNALPQQYNSILALAKEKSEKIQQVILGRREYASFIEVTHKALKELEEQFNILGKQPVGLRTEEVESLQEEYKSLLADLSNLGLAVSELNQKKEAFRSTGQPWRPEEMVQLVSLYNGLKRLMEQKVEHLGDTLESFEDHKAMALQLDSELKSTKEQLVKVNAETQSAEERLKNYHSLAGTLQSASSRLKRLVEQMENLAPHVDQAAHQASSQQVNSWQEELQSLQSSVGELIVECEHRFVQSKDFETEVRRTLDWLQQVRDELGAAVALDVKVEKVQEEMRKQQIVQEEVQSRLRIVAALSSREKQKYTNANELVPEHVDTSLEEMAKLEADVQQALSAKQITLEQALTLCQKYHTRMQSACEWLEDAVAFLQQASQGVDVENYEEHLRQQGDILSTEEDFLLHLQELESLPPQLESLVNPTASEQLRQSVESAQQRGVEVRDQLQCHQDVLNSCVAQWNLYQENRQTVIELMNEAEKKLTEFSTAKAATSQEAEEKLRSHKSLVALVSGFQEKLTGLEERAALLEQVGSDASKACISRSMTTVWQRWTRLRSVARGQEKVLEDTALEWRSFTEKMAKVTAVAEDLQSRLPDGAVEKASKAALQTLLEYHDSFSQEVEREHSAMALLRQYALSLLRDVEAPAHGQDELPALQDIRTVQERYEGLLQQVRRSRSQVQQELKDREEVERELGLVKTWIQDTCSLLLSPTADVDSLLQELEVLHGDVISHRQSVEKIAEQQQSKYLDLYTILPSEISMQLAEVQAKEREIQQIRDVKEDFSSRIQDVSEKMRIISVKLKEKATDVAQAKEETKALCDDLDACGRTLSELEASVREFGEQNPLLSKQLGDAIGKLREIHHHTGRLADYRTARLKKADSHLDEFNEMLDFIVNWTEKATTLVKGNIIWSSASQLQEQIRTYQAVLRESRELHGDLEVMGEKAAVLAEVLQTEAMSQRVSELSRHTEELQQSVRTRLQNLQDAAKVPQHSYTSLQNLQNAAKVPQHSYTSLQNLQDAAKDMERLECEVKGLHGALEQAQVTLTSPDLARLSLKEQLAQRQRLLTEMESFKQQVQAVQACQSGLRIPEEVVTSLSICRTAISLQQEASHLQHTAIQQCNILQEAVVQYEQYEQEVRRLQRLIEEAHRVIQDRPVSTSNIQELQAQILHHEELAQKIRGYQEQIASLNSKCKMLTMKAKHATMLLTVTEVEGLSEGLDELDAEELPKNPPRAPVRRHVGFFRSAQARLCVMSRSGMRMSRNVVLKTERQVQQRLLCHGRAQECVWACGSDPSLAVRCAAASRCGAGASRSDGDALLSTRGYSWLIAVK